LGSTNKKFEGDVEMKNWQVRWAPDHRSRENFLLARKKVYCIKIH